MDFDALLAPIEGPSPCGENLSFSAEFDQIAEMRREDDPTLDQGEWLTSLKVADWAGVGKLCSSLLATRSKDLRLMMWLTEAQALTQGYEGLRDGLRLCTTLCERHWDALHPQADGGDMEERIGNLGWLLQRVVSLADTRPITRGRQGGAAHSLRDAAAARQAQPGSEGLSLEQFNRALNETPKDLLCAHVDALRACHEQVLSLQTVVDAQLGHEGPSFVGAKDALASALHDLERLAREVGALRTDASETATTNVDANGDDAASSPSATGSAGGTRGPLGSRSQALQQLREVAAFFRRTEPHSPVAYLADKAVSWGEMPLHEWLRQVVKDPGSMSHLQELLGIPGDDKAAS